MKPESKNQQGKNRDFATHVNIFRGGVAVLFGVAIPLAINLYVMPKPISPQDNALIVLTSWAAGLATEILFELIIRSRETETGLRGVKVGLQQHQDNWVPSTDFDELLIEMRKHYKGIIANSRTQPDLYSEYYRNRLRGINRQLSMSANSRVLPVNIAHFDTTDILMSCLTDGNTDDFLAVHFLAENSYVQDVPHARRYLSKSEDKALKGELKNIRRLIIVDDGSEAEQLRDSFTVAFLGFHETSDKFDYRIIQSSIYRTFLRDAEPDNPLAEDFGVYGTWYVYETEVASAQAIQGRFSSDPDRILSYRRHFERCWDHGRVYSDFVDEPLPEVPRSRDIFDPFFQSRYHLKPTATSSAEARRIYDGAGMQFSVINATAGTFTAEQLADAISDILNRVRVCSMATVSPLGSAHIWTSFFSFTTSPFRLQVATPPVTEHAAHIQRNSAVAIAVHGQDQRWADPKTGIQLFGKARRVDENRDSDSRNIYLSRFPELQIGLARWMTLDGSGSHFYEVAVQRVKVIDEARFGEDVWVDAEVLI